MKVDILALTPVVNDKNNNLKGLAKIKINNFLIISDIRILNTGKGNFVVLPKMKIKDEYRDIFEIEEQEKREIFNTILDNFKLKCNGEIFEAISKEQKDLENEEGKRYVEDNVAVNMKINNNEESFLKAFGSIIAENGKFKIHNIRLVEFKNKLFLAFPNYKKDSIFVDICYSASKDICDVLQEKVIEDYNIKLKND